VAELAFRPNITPQAALRSFDLRKANAIKTFHWTDLWQHEHADSFTVAKSAGFDIVDDIASSLHDAFAGGETEAGWRDKIMPILQDKGWVGRKAVLDPDTGELVNAELATPRRLNIIYDTNMRTSYAAGRWVQMEQNVADQPYGLYLHGASRVPRPEHLARDHTCLPLDDAFWNYWAPPNGWGCSCSMISISQRQFDRMNGAGVLKTKAPALEFFDWINPRTGETVKTPKGIDPGFAYNPGKALLASLKGPALASRRVADDVRYRIALDYLRHTGAHRCRVCGG